MKFDSLLEYVNQLETHLSLVSKHASNLVKRNKDSANALLEFGSSITVLGQSEGESLGSGLQHMGNTVDQISKFSSGAAEEEQWQLDAPIQEYVRILGNVKAAIARRGEKKAAHLQAIIDLEAKQASYSKSLSSGKEAQIAQKQAEVEKAQMLVDSSQSEFETVSEKLLVEFERFKREKASDIKAILLNYVSIQVLYS